MYRILHVDTHSIHICSLLGSLIFIIGITLCLFLLHLSSYLARQLAYGILNSNPFFYWGVIQERLQVGDGQFYAVASKPSKDHQGRVAHCYTPIIDGEKIPSRTLKGNSRRSWAHDPEDSKSNPLVWAREHQAKREPSPVVGEGCISWLMVSLLALTKQMQLAKSSPQARHVSSKTAFLGGTSVSPRPSHKVLL